MGMKARPKTTGHCCVFWKEDEGDRNKTGWCLVVGSPDKTVTKQRTACKRNVMFPGKYSIRKPTCPDCLKLLAEGKAPKQPTDLRDLLRR
jgi:hypothetical protein